jgi:hypothetical protein
MVVNNSLGGEVHGERQLRQWMDEAGFKNVDVSPVTGIAGVMRGKR